MTPTIKVPSFSAGFDPWRPFLSPSRSTSNQLLKTNLKGRSPRDYRRRSHKPLHRICTGQDPAPVTQRICNTFAKINHYCDRNGRFRGTWRLCDDHCSCDRRHRSAWKHLRGTHLQDFPITHPVAKGLALAASSHAIGTAKAMELGEIEGAMSSLAIAVTGIMTVLLASLFSPLL